MFVVRADSPYKSIRDLAGKPVAFGARGSGLVILSRYVLDGLGMKQDDGFPIGLSGSRRRRPGDGAGRQGRGTLGRRHRLARICDDGCEPRGRPASSHPMPRRSRASGPSMWFSQAADRAAGQLSQTKNASINSVGSWSFVLARENLPDDVAYRLARTLHGGRKARCARNWLQACETTAANTVAAAPSPELIHPGVLNIFARSEACEIISSSRPSEARAGTYNHQSKFRGKLEHQPGRITNACGYGSRRSPGRQNYFSGFTSSRHRARRIGRPERISPEIFARIL